MEVDIDLTIIIVNWNSMVYLEHCLSSIYRNIVDFAYEVIVIDNASMDGCKEMLEQKFPQVQFIQSRHNLGFAKANNAAFYRSDGRNILFLNPDTEIKVYTLKNLYNWLNNSPDIGIVGGKLLNADQTIQTSCIQAFPTILNQFFNIEAIHDNHLGNKLLGTAPLFTNTTIPTQVDAVSGACLMIKRSVFESVGMFSTDYFMYSEDIDLCYKVKKDGWKTLYVPAAIIIHHGGKSTMHYRVKIFSSIMILESRYRFFRKTQTLWYCWLYRMTMFLSSIMRIGIVILTWPIYIMRGEKNIIKKVLEEWTACLRWVFGGEKWVKKYYYQNKNNQRYVNETEI